MCANVRFKLANPLYSMGDVFHPFYHRRDTGSLQTGRPLRRNHAAFSVSAMVSGTAWLISSGKLENSQDVMDLLIQKVSEEISLKDNHEKEI